MSEIRKLNDGRAAFFALAFALLFPGSEAIQKYFGTVGGIGIYYVAGIAILFVYQKHARRFLESITKKEALILAFAIVACLAILFFLIYPIADSGIFGGGGDSDDALNLAGRALLHYRYPYAITTYLGALATYLPGSLLLAIPFVILGNAAYQGIFWLVAFFVGASFYLKDVRSALALFSILFLNCQVLQSFVTGGELLASSIYLPVLMLFAMWALSEQRRPLVRWVACVLFGIGLSSRANFLLLVPIMFSAAVRRVGYRETFRYAAIVGATFLLVTLPFVFHDPKMFWRACVVEQRSVIPTSTLPHADILVPLISSVIALALARSRFERGDTDLLRNAALSQVFPVLAVVILSAVESGSLGGAGYGLHFTFFAVLACWKRFLGTGGLTSGIAAAPRAEGILHYPEAVAAAEK